MLETSVLSLVSKGLAAVLGSVLSCHILNVLGFQKRYPNGNASLVRTQVARLTSGESLRSVPVLNRPTFLVILAAESALWAFSTVPVAFHFWTGVFLFSFQFSSFFLQRGYTKDPRGRRREIEKMLKYYISTAGTLLGKAHLNVMLEGRHWERWPEE